MRPPLLQRLHEGTPTRPGPLGSVREATGILELSPPRYAARVHDKEDRQMGEISGVDLSI